jgi:hypothetical protein
LAEPLYKSLENEENYLNISLGSYDEENSTHIDFTTLLGDSSKHARIRAIACSEIKCKGFDQDYKHVDNELIISKPIKQLANNILYKAVQGAEDHFSYYINQDLANNNIPLCYIKPLEDNKQESKKENKNEIPVNKYEIERVNRMCFTIKGRNKDIKFSLENLNDKTNYLEVPDEKMNTLAIAGIQYLNDISTNKEFVCYFNGDQEINPKDPVSIYLKNSNEIIEGLLISIDLNHTEKVLCKYTDTLRDLKAKLMRKVEGAESEYPNYTYPYAHDSEYYYISGNKYIQLKDNDSINGKLDTKNNIIRVKFIVRILRELPCNDYFIKVFGTDNINSTLRTQLTHLKLEENKFIVAQIKKPEVNDNEQSISKFEQILNDKTFKDENIQLHPILSLFTNITVWKQIIGGNDLNA